MPPALRKGTSHFFYAASFPCVPAEAETAVAGSHDPLGQERQGISKMDGRMEMRPDYPMVSLNTPRATYRRTPSSVLDHSATELECTRAAPNPPASPQISDSEWDRCTAIDSDSSEEWSELESPSLAPSSLPLPTVASEERDDDIPELMLKAPHKAFDHEHVNRLPEISRVSPFFYDSMRPNISACDAEKSAADLCELERAHDCKADRALVQHPRERESQAAYEMRFRPIVSVDPLPLLDRRTPTWPLDTSIARTELDKMAKAYEAKLRKTQPPLARTERIHCDMGCPLNGMYYAGTPPDDHAWFCNFTRLRRLSGDMPTPDPKESRQRLGYHGSF